VNLYIIYAIYVYVELYTLEIHPGNLKGIGCPFNKNDAKPPLNVSPAESQGKSRPRNPTMKNLGPNLVFGNLPTNMISTGSVKCESTRW